MTKETLSTILPNNGAYLPFIKNYEDVSPSSFLSTHSRLENTLKTFLPLKNSANTLCICADNTQVHLPLIEQEIKRLQPEASTVLAHPMDLRQLAGSYQVAKGEIIQQNQGALEKANGGYLILDARWLIENLNALNLIKTALLTTQVMPINASPTQLLKSPPVINLEFKLIVLGSLEDYSHLEILEPDLFFANALFTEIEYDFKLSELTVPTYLSYLKWLTAHYQLPPLSPCFIETLLSAGARKLEDNQSMPFDLQWHLSLIAQSATFNQTSEQLTAEHLKDALAAKINRENYFPTRTRADLLSGHIHIATKGKKIGQINGLTVIEMPGHPMAYGEPARISCVTHLGDGEFSDVERKVELGGDLHAKGMMIMQAFLASALKLTEPLPFSASLVFEQSYSEIDGDSASLAGLCAYLSALSFAPINQQIAVTGAVDQFGQVQAIGGINEKIEGFYEVCKHFGLTGEQGVILPRTNLSNLALSDAVLKSIESGEFHLWTVSQVDEAIELLMGLPLKSGKNQDDESDSLLQKIADRIEQTHKSDSDGFFNWLKNCFIKH
jgi:Lon-like ATP-dependent protease